MMQPYLISFPSLSFSFRTRNLGEASLSFPLVQKNYLQGMERGWKYHDQTLTKSIDRIVIGVIGVIPVTA